MRYLFNYSAQQRGGFSVGNAFLSRYGDLATEPCLQFKIQEKTMLYLVIEGHEGSGKSTIATAIVKALIDAGHKAVHITEPMDIKNQVPYRTLLKSNKMAYKAQTLMFYANRIELMDQINEHLANGTIVVSDRSHISSHAIQKRVLTELGEHDMDEFFMDLDAFAAVNEPDILFHVIGQHRDSLASPNDALEADIVKSITAKSFAEDLMRVFVSYEHTQLVTLNNRSEGAFKACADLACLRITERLAQQV